MATTEVQNAGPSLGPCNPLKVPGSALVGRLSDLCDKSVKCGTLIAKDSPKKNLITGHCKFSIWRLWQPFFKMAAIEYPFHVNFLLCVDYNMILMI